MKISVRPRERQAGQRAAPPGYHFVVRTTARCSGLVSRRWYATSAAAKNAANRMVASLSKASKIAIRPCDGERARGAFCNPVISWGFLLTTGARCPGVRSLRFYGSSELAYSAGERMTVHFTAKEQ